MKYMYVVSRVRKAYMKSEKGESETIGTEGKWFLLRRFLSHSKQTKFCIVVVVKQTRETHKTSLVIVLNLLFSPS